MKLLFIGDIVGEPGRKVVKALVPRLREQHGLDFVIANGENSAGGSGITPKTATEIFSAGVDVITSGDHVWDQKEVMELLANEKRFLRPLNYPGGTPGLGSGLFEARSQFTVAVLNAQGRTFMPAIENPFSVVPPEVERLREQTKIIFVDFHAEATSEKRAFGWYVDGRATAVFGTHTHIQTSDEEILPHGTGYITDIGMTGSRESVIGMDKDAAINNFLHHTRNRLEVAAGVRCFSGVLLTVDEKGRTVEISRIYL